MINAYEIQPSSKAEVTDWDRVHAVISDDPSAVEIRCAGKLLATWASLECALDLSNEKAVIGSIIEREDGGSADTSSYEYVFKGAQLILPGLQSIELEAIVFPSYFIELRELQGDTRAQALGNLVCDWLWSD